MPNFKLLSYITALCILVLPGAALGQSLKTGFEALEVHDYFKAKKIFEKKKKRHKSIASFGLASVFVRPNNVFQNIDSAHVYVAKALEDYAAVKPRRQQKFARVGFTKENLLALRQQIATTLFDRAVSTNTEEAFVAFIMDNFWADEIPQATFYRDSLAFEKHVAEHFSEEMTAFLEKYPTSVFASRAQEAFYKFQFEEETASKRKEDYESFILNFPTNPFVKDADRALYRFAEDVNTVKSYEKFLENYPQSAYRNDAWRALYRAYIRQNGLALIGEFKKNYANYPFLAEIDKELSLLNTRLFPFFLEEKWGFMDQDGIMRLEPEFDFVEMFSQGRAAAQHGELFGFIDPVGNWIIRPEFTDVSPFRFNLSVVIDQKGNAGLINLFGEWILEPRFDDIQIINDDWLWIADDSGWILYQISKNQFGKEYFTAVSEFNNGFALVASKKEYALIDIKGNKLMSYSEEIERFGDLFVVHVNDSSALVNEFNDKILPFDVYSFGNFNPNGLTPFLKNEGLGYLNPEGKIGIEPKLDAYPNWSLFASFDYGHAKAFQQRTKKYGLIDQKGLWVLPPKYNDVSFYSDIIAVQISDKWEYVNKNGQRLNIGVFDRAESFIDSAGIVISNGFYGLVNATGEILIPLEMKRLLRLNGDLLRLEDHEGKLWLSNNQGQLIFDQPCDKIDRIDDGLIRMIVQEEVYYYLMKEKRLVNLQTHG